MKITTAAASPVRRMLIADLHCPYCGSDLQEVYRVPAARGTESSDPRDGVLQCACSEYPIVHTIPILQHLQGLEKVVRFIRENDTRSALLQTLNAFRVKWARTSRWHQVQYYLNCRRLVTDRHLTFEDAVGLVRKPNSLADYLLHRYANPSFLADMALLPLLGAFVSTSEHRLSVGPTVAPLRVLDLACGAGHSSFLLTHWFPELSVVAADQDFVSLYLAKRFLTPAADLVCTDAEVPSPFCDRYFDAVHCLDAFHYFKSKMAIVEDLRRVTKPGALWVFPHLHNSLAQNVTAGLPLSPEHYLRCFEFLDPVMFDEVDLRRSLRPDSRLCDVRLRPVSELSKAQTIALVGGASQVLRDATPLSGWLSRDRSILRKNPIYQGGWRDGTLRLALRWPNVLLRHECRDAEEVLPHECEVSGNDLNALLNGCAPLDPRIVRDLVSRFVLVPLPARYSRCKLISPVSP